MNCREITGILDNQKAALDPGQRRDAEAHVATCKDCAEAWHLQNALAELPGMPLPYGFAGRCRALVAQGVQAAPNRRTVRRILVGTLAALAAAAAVVMLLPRPVDSTGPGTLARNAPVADVEVNAPVIDLSATEFSPDVPQTSAIEAPAKPKFTVSIVPPRPLPAAGSAPASGVVPPADLEAVRALQNSPPRQQAVQAFQSALLEELRRVPGLTLVDPDQPVPEPAGKNYRVAFMFLTQLGLDGRAVPGDSRIVELTATAEQLKADGQKTRRMMSFLRIDLLAPCAGIPPVAGAPPCNDPRGQATEVVRKLRQEVFPPDPSVTRPLQARLQDTSLDASQRIKTFEDLFRISKDQEDLALLRDPGVVRAALALAANGDPTLRAQIWRMMRGAGNPDFIQPMLASLTQDPADVRLAAIETLAGDFLGDPRVRAALASLVVEDPNPLVRAVADRGISGEASWRRYVVGSLGDANRPAAQRVEALVYYLYPPGATAASSTSHPDYWQILDQLDDKAVRALAEALPNAGKLQGGSTYNLLGNFSSRHAGNPAVTEMSLGLLERSPNPTIRIIAGQSLARTQYADPRVRDALTKAVQGDPEPSVRDQIRQTIPAARP